MKQYNVYRLVLTVLLVSCLLPGCKKSSGSSDSGNNNTSGYYLSATINGQAWNANVSTSQSSPPAMAAITNSGSTSILLLLGIKAVNKDTSGVALIFPRNIALNKTLNLDPSQYMEAAYLAEISPGSGTYYTYNTTSATGGSGTITLTLFDQSAKVLEGTFNGTFGSQDGRSAVNITNGRFRCPYTTDITQLPKSGVKF